MLLSGSTFGRFLPLATATAAFSMFLAGSPPCSAWAGQSAVAPSDSGDTPSVADPAVGVGGMPDSSVQTSVTPPEARQVVAWGRAAIGPGGVAGAREAAKAHALRDAVEKTTGVFVSARTLTHNFELVRDQVVTHAEGFATLKDIIREVDTPQTVTLWMRAEVSLRPLAQQLKALNLTRAWRIRVTAAAADDGEREGNPTHDDAVVDALEKTLLEAGFVVVSSDDDADIAVRVTPQFGPASEGSSNNRDTTSSSRSARINHPLRGDIRVRATRAQTGEVVAVLSSAEASSPADSAAAGIGNSVDSAVRSVAPRLADALMLLPARDSQPVQLVVRGIGTAARATHLENLLGGLSGVRSVTRRSFDAGDAIWEMDVLSDAQPDLARQMEEAAGFKPFHLSVTSDTLAKIVASAPFGRHPLAKTKPAASLAAKTDAETLPPTAKIAGQAAMPPAATGGYRNLNANPNGSAGASRSTADLASQDRVNPRDGAQMVWVPQGPFIMGDDDIGNNPRHRVNLSGYFIYKDLVTVAMYRRFCATTGRRMPYPPRGGWRENQPIVSVTYADTCDYCDWAGVRLPTEAEWEKAARGTDGRRFPWGNDFRTSRPIATYHSPTFGGVSLSVEVGSPSFPKENPYGVEDMEGKVCQWCADWYDPNFAGFARPDDPTGPYRSHDRVVRGAAADAASPLDYRAARRKHAPPNLELSTIGFRAVAAPIRWARGGAE